MNSKLLYLLLPLGFSRCLASMPLDISCQNDLNSQLLVAAGVGSIDLIHKLLQKGAEINARDKTGLPALHIATIHGHSDCVKKLIQEKAYVNARDNSGATALHWAVLSCKLNCLKALIEAHADGNAPDSNGITPLHYAAQNRYLDCLKALIEAKVDINAQTTGRESALLFAAHYGYVLHVEALLEAGANSTAVALDGRTPILAAACSPDFLEQIRPKQKTLKNAHQMIRLFIKYGFRRKLYTQEKIREARARIHAFFELFRDRARELKLKTLNSRDLQFWILRFGELQEDVAAVFLDELQQDAPSLHPHTMDLAKSLTVEYLITIFKQEFKNFKENLQIDPTISEVWDPERNGIDSEIRQLILEGINARIAEIRRMNGLSIQTSSSSSSTQ